MRLLNPREPKNITAKLKSSETTTHKMNTADGNLACKDGEKLIKTCQISMFPGEEPFPQGEESFVGATLIFGDTFFKSTENVAMKNMARQRVWWA